MVVCVRVLCKWSANSLPTYATRHTIRRILNFIFRRPPIGVTAPVFVQKNLAFRCRCWCKLADGSPPRRLHAPPTSSTTCCPCGVVRSTTTYPLKLNLRFGRPPIGVCYSPYSVGFTYITGIFKFLHLYMSLGHMVLRVTKTAFGIHHTHDFVQHRKCQGYAPSKRREGAHGGINAEDTSFQRCASILFTSTARSQAL